MAAYTFTYQIEYGCALEKDPFWRNLNVCELLLKYRFEEHSASQRMSCFKRGCECRFLFPFMSANCTYIHKDRGEKNEKKYCGISRIKIYPFIVLPKRPMGCQYMNPHKSSILKVFNFNTNIQLGDVSRFSTAHCTQANHHKKRTVRNNYRLDVLLLRGLRDYLMKKVLRQFKQTTSIMTINSWDRNQMMSAIKLEWNLVLTRD